MNLKRFYIPFLAVFFLFAANGFVIAAACCNKCGDKRDSACHHQDETNGHSHENACHFYFLKTDEAENYTAKSLSNSLSNVFVADVCGANSFVCYFCVIRTTPCLDTCFSSISILAQSCVLLC